MLLTFFSTSHIFLTLAILDFHVVTLICFIAILRVEMICFLSPEYLIIIIIIIIGLICLLKFILGPQFFNVNYICGSVCNSNNWRFRVCLKVVLGTLKTVNFYHVILSLRGSGCLDDGVKRNVGKTAFINFRKTNDIKSTSLWGVTPCSPLEIHRHFGGT
jgi:hypothetical protein